MGYATLLTLAIMLPFELQAPLVQAGPLAISNLELLLALTLVLALLHWHASRPRLYLFSVRYAAPQNMVCARSAKTQSIKSLAIVLLLVYIVALLLAAVFAPALQANALRAALRTIAGMMLIPATLLLVRSSREWWGVLIALIGGGMVAAVIGIAEVLAGYDFVWLQPWRDVPTVAGPFLRLAGPFDYANQAAMFLEATLPIFVAIGIELYCGGRQKTVAVPLLAFAIYIQAAVLTFSRAALGAAVLSHLAIAGWILLRSPAARRTALWWGSATALLLLLILGNYFLSPVFRLRLQSQVDSDWYQAQIQVPASLTMKADETLLVPVSIVNTGSLTWFHSGTNQFNLGMRWQLEDSNLELSRHPRWPLSRNVAPGESITLEVPLRAPLQGGRYRLVWDMVHENVTWFAAKNPTEAHSEITVSGEVIVAGSVAAEQLPAVAAAPMQFDAPIPARSTLWLVALRLARLYPLTGIGLDNFRLTYGHFVNSDVLAAGIPWNDTIHTNNWYLETLVSLGIAGLLPFLVLSAWLLLDVFRTIPIIQARIQPVRQKSAAFQSSGHGQTAVAVGLLAYFVHGILDYFLLFNATALLFWMLVGLWLVARGWALESHESVSSMNNGYANRI
jgi:hypothetical protein